MINDPRMLAFLNEYNDTTATTPEAAVCLFCKVSSLSQIEATPEAKDLHDKLPEWFAMWKGGAGFGVTGAFKMGAAAYRRGSEESENPFDPKERFDCWPGNWFAWRDGYRTERGLHEHRDAVT